MTGVALLNRITNLLRNQNHESNGGFPLHPSLKIAIWVNKKGEYYCVIGFFVHELSRVFRKRDIAGAI
jgi:hypothetical protein